VHVKIEIETACWKFCSKPRTFSVQHKANPLIGCTIRPSSLQYIHLPSSTQERREKEAAAT
jgi:hypothetical protein